MVRDRPFTRTYLLEKGLDNTVGLHLVGNKVVKIERGSSAERWVECMCVCVCVHACVCVCVCGVCGELCVDMCILNCMHIFGVSAHCAVDMCSGHV